MAKTNLILKKIKHIDKLRNYSVKDSDGKSVFIGDRISTPGVIPEEWEIIDCNGILNARADNAQVTLNFFPTFFLVNPTISDEMYEKICDDVRDQEEE